MVTTDEQVKGLFKRMTDGKALYVAAQQSGMCENTARKYHRQSKLPSELKEDRDWRTHPDAFADVWGEIEALLTQYPHLQAKAAFEDLQRRFPGRFANSQLRTLQRRFECWRSLKGAAKEVFFPQDHHPGELGASDFTRMTPLGITIAGTAFDHMLYHFVLTWSNWEHGSVCFSESLESLSSGLQNALLRCGGSPQWHRTDGLSAAVNNLDEKRDFTVRYEALLRHYGMSGEKTNPDSGNENGDIESRNRRFKDAVEQALIFRGSRDFTARGDYDLFLNQLFDRLNAGRAQRFEEERTFLRPLPTRRLPDYTELRDVLVSKGSTIRVRKNVYSVHSRLRDEHVTVKLYAEHLDVLLGSALVERLPRLRGSEHHRINYRHIIDWLIRKPGAFVNYRYRSDLFPTSHFRIAYDVLQRQSPVHADKEYLQILYDAAYGSEERANQALQQLIADGATLSAAAVRVLVQWLESNGATRMVEPYVAPIRLDQYDDLLVAQGGGQ
jgi:hypothetical protein